jgi:hypothetical protein
MALAGAWAIAAAGALWLAPPPIRPLMIGGAEMLGGGGEVASPGVALQPGLYELVIDAALGAGAQWECALAWPGGRREVIGRGELPAGAGRAVVACAIPPGGGAARFELRLRPPAGGPPPDYVHLMLTPLPPRGINLLTLFQHCVVSVQTPSCVAGGSPSVSQQKRRDRAHYHRDLTAHRRADRG